MQNFILYGIGIAVFIVIAVSIKVIYQFDRGVKFTLGKYSGLMEPGIRLVIPLLQAYEKVDVRQTTLDLQKQEVMTRDQVNLKIDGVVFYNVTNPAESVLNVIDLRRQIADKATSELKEVVGKMNMSDALQSRDAIAKELEGHLNKAIYDLDLPENSRKPWGVNIKGIQINNIELPESLVRAMAKEAEAEREKKAIMIRSAGEKEAAQNYKEASNIYSNPFALRLRELKTYEEIGKEHNSLMIVIPETMVDNKWVLPLGKTELDKAEKQK